MIVANVMELIEQERDKSGLSAERFANAVGITSATYSRQNNDRQKLGVDSIRRYAAYFREVGNTKMLQVLAAYVLDIAPDEIVINPPAA